MCATQQLHLKPFLLFGLLLISLSSCNLIKGLEAAPEELNASSIKKAIVVDSNQAEYDWLNEKFPGYTLIDQELIIKKEIPYDKITIMTAEGKEESFFFDISSFYNKGL